MNAIRYLAIFCIVIILGAISSRSLKDRSIQRLLQQTRMIESVVVDHDSPFVDIDKNILIDDHGKPIILRSEKEVIKKVVIKPYISAESYLVANLLTGEIYSEFNSNKIFPIASVSKLYTALVVHHMLDSGKIISITQSMLDAYGESGHLVLDEKFTRDELLHFLLLESSNDVAEAFAQTFGHSTSTNEFMEEMNSFAHEIGMQNTFFKDPSGLNPANVSNAKDLFTLSKYLYKSEKDLLEISRKRVLEIATTTDHGSHHLININPYVYYTGFIGGKTGRTDYAKETMVSLFDQEVGDTKYPIVIIILRSEFGQREIDTEKLLDLFIKKVSGGI